MRRGELLGLRWCDVDLNLAILSVVQTLQRLHGGKYIVKEPKNAKSRRSVALPPSLAIVLRNHREDQVAQKGALDIPTSDTDLVFAHADGAPLDPSTVSHTFLKAVKKAGLSGFHLHSSRHTHATLMLKQGIHPKIVQERLGHSTVATTLDLYSHVAPNLQEQAPCQHGPGGVRGPGNADR